MEDLILCSSYLFFLFYF